MKIKWFYSNETKQWKHSTAYTRYTNEKTSLFPTGREFQKMLGFGGCFNELGYVALKKLSDDKQEQLMLELFSDIGCNLNLCRLPIGANDYSKDWYSLDDMDQDFELSHFSIERDKDCLIPYVKYAQKYQKDLMLFSSPWSPPTWLKYPSVYNWGKLIWDDKYLKTYALYFLKYVQAYKEIGIKINQIHVQNEPVANQKFPSCMWTGEELKEFIRDYLGPAFEAENMDAEIWLGTINAPGCDYNRLIFDKWATEDYDYFANEVLHDEGARKYISGVSYQWGGKIAIQRTFESWWPEIRLMQSENECGFGDNTWEYARYVWTMMKHYITNGAESYMYWNLILEPGGRSTWGDPQNAMVTVQAEQNNYVLNPDYYVMKHFSSAVERGAIRLEMKGAFAGDSVVFRNPNGSMVYVIFNPFKTKETVTILYYDENISFELEPQSINTIMLEEE